MVAVIKYCLFIVAVFVASFDGSSAAGVPAAGDADVLALSAKKMEHAIAALNVKIQTCDDEKRMKTTVPAKLLGSVSLSNKEWGTALLHLSTRATERCIGSAWGDALAAFAQFKFIEKKLTGKNTIDTSPYDFETLCCVSEMGKLQTELEYLKINAKVRQQLEAIPALHEPFNPISTKKELLGD